MLMHCVLVIFTMNFLCKQFATDLTTVRFLSSMDSCMSRQFPRRIEDFFADITGLKS